MQTIQTFKIHLERLGYTQTSINMLPNCLKEFLECQGHSQIEKITPTDIIHYYQYLQERPNKRRPGGLSESFINHHLYALKLFFAWQLDNGEITQNPISHLSFPTPTSQTREILNQEEIKLLYQNCQTLKEKAILTLYYGCGLRRSEGEKLNLKDIRFRSNLLYVRQGKYNKRRAVPLSEQVKKDLWNYTINERYNQKDEQGFITGQRGKRIRGESCNKILKEILLRTGINKNITLHSLRHSIATHLLERGLSVEFVRDFLGHRHLESTQIYTRINQEQLCSLKAI